MIQEGAVSNIGSARHSEKQGQIDLNSPQGYLHIKEFSSKIVNNTLFNQTNLFILKYKYPKHGQVTLDKN